MVSPDRDNRKTHPEHSPAFSRRSFLIGSGTTVAALMLPCLGFFGGKYAYALDPDAAADGESNSGDDATTKIIILSNSEIGLSVYDVNEQGKTTPVIGAKVVVTPANQDAQKLEATTDDLGAVVFDIRDIGTPLDYGDDGIRYRMEASVTVTNGDDYRICTLPRIRVDSGSAMALPCCKITDPSIPYFEYLSFNGWDIQYCDCDVLRSGEARNKIPLSGKLHMAGLQSVEISFWARSTEGEKKLDDKARFTTRIEMKNDVGAFKQNELFLRLAPPDNATLPLNRSFEFHLKTADKTYVFPVKLTVHDSPIAYQTGNEGIVPGVTYGQTGSSRTIFKLPSSFPPVLRSSSFTCWVPTLPIEFWVSPFGYFYFGAGLSPSKEGNSIEAFKKESFAYETFQTSDQQCSDLKNMWTNKWNTYKSMTKGTSPGSTSKFNHKFASKIGLSFAIQAIITAQCNLFEKEEDMRFNGLLAVVGDVYAFANFVQQFTIGPVPFFIALNLSFDARISLYATAESPAGDPLNISFVPSKTGLGIVFTFEIALSLGVGLSGVLAASLRGSGQISTYIGLISCEEEIGSGTRHVVVSAGLSADLVLQALIFKWSGNIWSEDWPALYDNWKPSNDGVNDASVVEGTSYGAYPTGLALGVNEDGTGKYSNSDPAGLAAAGMEGTDGAIISLTEFGKVASIVTSDELLKTKEASATAVSGFKATPAKEPVSIANNMFATPLAVANPEAANEAEEGADGYLYEDAGEDPQGACDAIAGVGDIAENGGIIPSKDIKIVSKSFSNPREKIVVYDNTTFLFRLASVDYNLNGTHVGRSRLVVQVYNEGTGRWGRPKVLDIPVTIADVDRADMFDCDFDVCTQTDPNPSSHLSQGIYVSIVSTLRPNGDNTSFFNAACAPILTIAAFDHNLRRLTSVMWRDDPGATLAKSYAITCPRITTLSYQGRPLFVTMAYLRHAASSPEAVFSDSATTTCNFAVHMENNLVHTSNIALPSTTDSLVIAPSVTSDGDEDSGGDPSSSFSVFYTAGGMLNITTITLSFTSSLIEAASENELEKLKSFGIGFSKVHNIRNLENITDMQPWPGHSSFLTLANGDLTESSFDPKVENGSLTTRIVGPDKAKLSAFKISENGNVLMYTENKEGKSAQQFDDRGNPTDSVVEKRHRIMASLYADGLFSEPFSLGQTTHPLDSLVGVSGRSSYTFVATSITDMANSTADMYYIDLPVVATASVLSLACDQIFILQGDSAPFVLVLRNDGNVILKGCKATLYDADTGEKASEAALNFSAENICASAWNPELFDDATEEEIEGTKAYSDEAVEAALGVSGVEGAHQLADPVNAGVLLPGKTGQYRTTFTIPKSWHGTKNVYVALSDFSYETVVSAAPDGTDPIPLEHEIPHEELPRTELSVHDENEAFDSGLSAPSIGILADDHDTIEPTENTQSGTNTTTGENTQKGLTNTGDPSSLTLAGLAVGAAAAAFAAYSARRSSLENSKDEEMN